MTLIKKCVAIGVITLGLTGCIATGNPLSDVLKVGNKAEVEALSVSKAFGCEGIDIALWIQEFGSDPKKAEAWATLCGKRSLSLPGS